MHKLVWKLTALFISWRLMVSLGLVAGLVFLPINVPDRFLGGGPNNYLQNPILFSWANFDGEHYLSIAIFGYKGLEQAFFPLYPALMSVLARPFAHNLQSSLLFATIFGVVISNLALLVSIFFLFKLINLDYSKKVTYWTLVILLAFPTSFYFGAVYNESLYLLISVLAFYCARKNRWELAGIFGFLAVATRIFGIVLLPALLIEAVQQRLAVKRMLWLMIIPFGLISYMLYQGFTTNDPLAFYHLQKLVGEQHQSGLTLLPQVYFRYLKMLLTVDRLAPIYQTIILELIVGILFFLLPVFAYLKRVRLSYTIYSLIAFLIPTIQGSFSSLPRYVIVFFPSFIALSLLIEHWPLWIKVISIALMVSALIVESALFLRGYWVA